MTELLWRVSRPTGQTPQNPPRLCSPSAGLGGSAGARGLMQRSSPSSPPSSRDYRGGKYIPNRPDLLPIPWPWPSLNPFFLLLSLQVSVSLHLLLSLPLAGFSSFLSPCPNMRLPLLTSSQALSSLFFPWAFLLKFLAAGEQLRFVGAEQSWRRQSWEQNNSVVRTALMSTL